jgi:pyruvate formate lyase activating enzyme
MSIEADITGKILHYQRLSTEDGPGLRTTIFMKGCPLACAWCHNPESISREFQLQWVEPHCIGCNTCIGVCPGRHLVRGADGLQIDREQCDLCGRCVDACPAGALEMLGQEVTAGQVVREMLKDRAYFDKSGGGVTFSGGEPTGQPGFSLAVMRALHEQGVGVALDTCGLCSRSTLEEMLPYCDQVLFDLKLIDSERHQALTGQSNRVILENLNWLIARIREQGKPALWIRTPVIPGATDDAENLEGIGRWLAEHGADVIERWELCSFNNLCRDKYERLGQTWLFEETRLLTAGRQAEIYEMAGRGGLDSQRIFVTGACRVEED